MSYSRSAFSPLRVVALYFSCDLGLDTWVLSQAAGQLRPEAIIGGTLLECFMKLPALQDDVLKPWSWAPPAWAVDILTVNWASDRGFESHSVTALQSRRLLPME